MENVSVQCLDCGEILPLDWETYISKELDWAEMWREHGHYPGKAKLICSCGKCPLTVGPDEDPDPVLASLSADAWDEMHAKCHNGDNGRAA